MPSRSRPAIPPRRGRRRAFSLVEMLTATTILSLLALMAVPYAQTAKDREREVILKTALSRLRHAIHIFAYTESNGDDDGDGLLEEDAIGDLDCDGFQDDDRDGLSDEDGPPNFPATLDLLVSKGYLSLVPLDPMQDPALPAASHWELLTVKRQHVVDAAGTVVDNEGIYDIRSKSPGTGLNGTPYSSW